MNSTNCKVTIILRSVGERTESLCRALILAQGVPEVNVFLVHEAPFSAAMRKSFEIGLEQGRPWTLCVDADILLRPGAVEQMVTLAGQQEANICEVQGYILDKFFGGPRNGGVHLYRTSLLPRVIASIPAEGVDVRPEFRTLQSMAQQGFPWCTVPYLVGLHDFEQYYRDIFRKCFVHARKHQQYAELLLSVWQGGASRDMDYRVALHGFAAGILHEGDVRIDVQQEVYQERFAALQVAEKPALREDYLALQDIEQLIVNWNEPVIYRQLFPTQGGLSAEVSPPRSLRENFALQLQARGPLKIIPYSLGWLFQHVGHWLEVVSS